MNNDAEYEALIAGLGLIKEMGIRQIQVHNESQLEVNQMQGTYQAWDLKMIAYLKKAMELKDSFDEVKIQ